MKTPQERILARKVLAVTGEVERVLRTDHNVKWFRIKDEDQIRLLRLGQWSEQYHVSIRYILSKLIPHWTAKYAQYNRQVVFGTTIPTLVGQMSESVILYNIARDYPDGENVARWKAISQQRQWARIWDGTRKEFSLDPIKAVQEYKKRIQMEREERKDWERKLARKKYRENPWV